MGSRIGFWGELTEVESELDLAWLKECSVGDFEAWLVFKEEFLPEPGYLELVRHTKITLEVYKLYEKVAVVNNALKRINE